MPQSLEWQVCAAKGLLPGQGSQEIKFGYQPSSLRPDGATGKPLGQCHGWVPEEPPAGDIYGFATDDIFYLEVRSSVGQRQELVVVPRSQARFSTTVARLPVLPYACVVALILLSCAGLSFQPDL